MALPVTFGPLTAAQMAQLDEDFAAVGALATLQCSATGTNSLVLTPAANQPALSGYGLPNPLKFGFTAAATSTGNVTLEVSTFGFLPVYTSNGVQATTGTLVFGNYYEVTYTTGMIYNSGAGAWVLSSYQSGTGTVPVAGSSIRGLKMANNAGTPNTQIDVSFQQGCLVSATGVPAFLGILSATLDLTTGTVTSTANGMDGESRPASGWVYVYAISTGSGTATLGTTVSPLSGPPTLPAGYAYYAYAGAMWCDGSSNLFRSKQLGQRTSYTVIAATNTAAYPVITSGSSGTINTTTFTGTSTSISTFVPPTASVMKFLLSAANNSASMAVAPSNTFAGYQSTTNPVPYELNGNLLLAEIQLETTNIFYASNMAAAKMQVIGWTDYTSAGGG